MKSSIKIGRDNTNDVIINEPSVSRNHAIITNLGNGSYEAKDLGSRNGTFVNGQKIVRQIIKQGDKLKVASSNVDWQAAFQVSSDKKVDSIIQEEPFSKIIKTITVGSAPDNDLVLSNNYVSGHHAKISKLKTGNFYLQDVGSSNGSFVNGAKVTAKNFTKTDVVKIANADLPKNWFLHKSLKRRLYKDNKKTFWTTLIIILLISGGAVFYYKSCTWFNCYCNLIPKQMYSRNANALVHIEHEYYYTITFKGTKYYVGKNKSFVEQTEANPEKQNILPYNKISGSGCFVKSDGSILTSPVIINPWLYNNKEIASMLGEVVASKTINGLKSENAVKICGETADLNWIQNRVVNNKQNFVEATANNDCILTDSATAIMQSIKKMLPSNASVAEYSFNKKSIQHLHNTPEKYYAYIILSHNNQVIKDSFITTKDSLDINKVLVTPLAESLPRMQEGSAVFNSRGELIGIVQQQQVVLLNRFINQIHN